MKPNRHALSGDVLHQINDSKKWTHLSGAILEYLWQKIATPGFVLLWNNWFKTANY